MAGCCLASLIFALMIPRRGTARGRKVATHLAEAAEAGPIKA
jgi:ABC-type thiamin/hydroxymethylpyrimidine transport system permease subunit